MKLTDLIYDEWYGEITVAQNRAYKKHNVSPSDHDDLVEIFGSDQHAEITAAVVDPKNNMDGGNCFSTFLFHRTREEER